MHLLREGQFDVAASFISGANTKPPRPRNVTDLEIWHDAEEDTHMEDQSWEERHAENHADSEDVEDMDTDERDSPDLRDKFSDMYRILGALQHERDLQPAIEWARLHSDALESRGSDLEFELCRLRFVELYQSNDVRNTNDGPLRALEYARTTFLHFSTRYLRETSSLLGALAFAPAVQHSPYNSVFFNSDAWNDVSSSFTREFCGLLGLSEKSPLYTAVTAGGIALPVLEKLERVMGEVGGQWTSANELPVRVARRTKNATGTNSFRSRYHCHRRISFTPSSYAP